MNIVFVTHGTSAEYAFMVPDDLVKHIKKDQTVLVETTKGLCTGITKTGILSGDGALDLAISKGAYEPLKPVVGFLPNFVKERIITECKNAVALTFGHMLNALDLPF